MSSSRETIPPPQSEPVGIVSPKPSPGLDSLAGKITRRTTDLIVIGIIIVAGLTVAQRLLTWWKTDPSEVLADPEIAFSRAALNPWGAGPDGVVIDLAGKPLTLRRRAFQGTYQEAQALLRGECRQILTDAQFALQAPSPEEKRLIEMLSRHPAAESGADGRWTLHEIAAPLSMTLAVRRGNAPGEVDRVVCWGLVLPSDEGSWSILSITPRSTRSAGRVGDSVPLPPGSQPGLAVRDEQGGQFLTFTGGGPIDQWREHFDRLAEARKWVAIVEWRIEPEAVSATWIAHGAQEARVDLRMTQTETGWAGLINISPTRQKDHP